MRSYIIHLFMLNSIAVFFVPPNCSCVILLVFFLALVTSCPNFLLLKLESASRSEIVRSPSTCNDLDPFKSMVLIDLRHLGGEYPVV